MRIRGRSLAVIGVVVALGVGAVVAYADSINADGDILKPNNNISYTEAANFTQHCSDRGVPLTGAVTVKFNGTKHYDPGATVTFASVPDAAGSAAGILTSGGSAVVPDPWDTTGETFSGPITTTVPVTVPNGTYIVTVTASGPAHDAKGEPLTLTADDTFEVSVACNAAPPAIAWVSAPATANEGDLQSYQFSISDPDSTSWSYAAGQPSCGSAGSLVGAPSIDSSARTGTFTCSFPNGPASSTVSAAVSDGTTTSNVLTQAVAVANVAPAVSFTSAPPTAFEGDTKTYAFAVSDPGASDTYTAAAGYPSCGPRGAVVAGSFSVTGNHGSQTGSFSCSFTTPGLTTVGIGFTDSDGATGTPATTSVSVLDAPLTAGALTITDGVEGLTASNLTFGFTDANPAGAVADYSASIDWGDSTTSSGTISAAGAGFQVDASHLYAEEGTYMVTVTVTDTGGATASATGQAIVHDAPLTAGTLTIGPGVAGVTAAPLSFDFTDANPGGTAADFTASIDWGDSTTSAGTVAAGGAGFNVQGSHVYAHAGTFTVVVTVTDVGGSSTSATGVATVAASPLTAGALTITNSVEGVTPAQLTFAFTDANPAAAAADFTATVDWGDATSSPGTVGASGAGFQVAASHSYADEGTYTVKVTVTSADGSTTSATGTATVSDAPLTARTLTLTNGVQNGPPATLAFGFTDANPVSTVADFTASVDWGDSTVTAGAVTAVGGGYSVAASHVYTSAGTFTVTVAVTDAGGRTTSAAGTVTVAKSGLTAGALTIGNGVEGVAPAQLSFRFTSANPLAEPGDFTATVKWGDHASSNGTVSTATGGGFAVTASHLFKEEGTYSVTVTVTDKGGNSVSASGKTTIADAPLTATAPTLQPDASPFVGTVANFTDANPYASLDNFTAKIDWGDGERSYGLVIRSGSGFAVKGAHWYSHTGYYTIKTAITDDGGSKASASTQLLVFAFLRHGSFVIGDRSASGSVTFYSSQWWKKNSLSGGTPPSTFYGWASDSRDPSCHARWSAPQGGSGDVPDDLPDYMAVIVSSQVTKSGSKITGDTVRMVIVRTVNGQGGSDHWHTGTGTVVASVPGC